jgi:hypothetical protein
LRSNDKIGEKSVLKKKRLALAVSFFALQYMLSCYNIGKKTSLQEAFDRAKESVEK